MKKLIIVALVSICSCAGPKLEGEFPAGCKPFDLHVDVDSQKMTVKWRKACSRTISGYNIYISTTPLAPKYGKTQLPKEIVPINEVPFPGDTNPDDSIETYEAQGLTDGIKYFVSVRILLSNGIQSKPTSEIPVVCGPTGEIELAVRFKSDNDGFSFSHEETVRADNEKNDIYYFNSEGVDYLSSPKRLNGFLRDVKLSQLPFRGTLEQVKSKLPTLESTPSDDKIAVIPDDWVRLYTPESTNVLIKVLGFTGEGDGRKIKLYYAYSPLKNELFY